MRKRRETRRQRDIAQTSPLRSPLAAVLLIDGLADQRVDGKSDICFSAAGEKKLGRETQKGRECR